MFERITAGAKLFFRLHCPGRTLQILPDDVFLVSFPKSGNTWTRFLIANLTHPETPATFGNIHELVPDPEGTAKKIFDRMSRPRVIKSHECFDPRFPRAMYIVRDPRDVVLSQYHYHRKCRKIDDDYPMEKFVDRFLAGQTCPVGSWGENVSSWLVTRRNDPRFLLLRYEDLIADTAREMQKIAAFLGIGATREQVVQAVERSSAENMRKLEQAQSHLSSLTKASRKDLPFVRAASSGNWKSSIPHESAARIEAAWGPIMTSLNYELTTRPSIHREGVDLINEVVSR
jgi:hypothetical protein